MHLIQHNVMISIAVQMYETWSSSTRILKLMSYWTSVIIVASYSASFYSFLTLRNPVIPFSSFQELLEDGTYTLGVLRYSSLFPLFRVRDIVTYFIFIFLILLQATNDFIFNKAYKICRPPR